MCDGMFLNEYSFERLCEQIEALDIYGNPYDRFLFTRAAITSVQFEMKRERGIDILTLTTFDEIADYVRLVLQPHPKLTNADALIVVTTALRIEINKILRHRSKQPPEP